MPLTPSLTPLDPLIAGCRTDGCNPAGGGGEVGEALHRTLSGAYAAATAQTLSSNGGGLDGRWLEGGPVGLLLCQVAATHAAA
eukprot:5608316-Pyramimonas_sp.AAC.1